MDERLSTPETRERFGEVDWHRGTYTWSCPECSARYSDAWGGSDTELRRRQHILGHFATEGVR